MPWSSPRSLTDDQVYVLTAYILAQNKLIGAKQVINAQRDNLDENLDGSDAKGRCR